MWRAYTIHNNLPISDDIIHHQVPPTTMPLPDEILQQWKGMIDNDFRRTIQTTFGLSENDNYVYKVESFSMTLAQVEAAVASGEYVYRYAINGQMQKVECTSNINL
jgi:hypothetical protein